MNLRLFAALDPPGTVRRRLAALQEALRGAMGAHAAEVRFTPADRLHVTLQFLGAVPEERLPAVRTAIEETAAASRPLRLVIRGAAGFPTARRPRVIVLRVEDDGALAALAATLGRALAPLGFPPDGRPFSPHLTVGRSRDARGAPGTGGALATATLDPVPWRVEDLVLFRSTLGPGGARHDEVARAPLGPPGTPAAGRSRATGAPGG